MMDAANATAPACCRRRWWRGSARLPYGWIRAPRRSEMSDDAALVAPPLGAAALMALTHPPRFQLWELLHEHGPATVSQLAIRTGEGTEVAGAHLGELARHGLIEDAPQRGGVGGDGSERWWRTRPGAFSFQPHLFEGDPVTAKAAHFLETELLRLHTDRLNRWLAVSRSMPLAWREVSFDGSMTLHLTRDELAELAAQVLRVMRDFRARRRDGSGPGGEPTARTEVFFHAFPISLDESR
jgi:hypothetical protein